ncbi:UDP-glucose 4-epimerase [Mycobacterium sp. MS1601]|uniref:NAD-dependent epimerase/dehydratase family protein n=1 Tax=Mycobacterium sp. MS1601 TaxID=1936029 RepID=UPI0009797A09|nr:NAD-dependent epimerase/dehydratase family protein [Mycobacterium sp. MS1601]AQA01857.1 UDP-glucose 4-epimerase [Mycobacterium sp. MS1601]
MTSRRVVVTGIAGFIGSTLAEKLLASDPSIEIVGIDRFTDYYPREIKSANVESLRDSGVTIVEEDIVGLDLDELLDGTEVIFHQAGQPGVRPSWGNSFDAYTHDNILASQRLLEAARRSTSLKRFVYASSSSVYGDAERFPTLETDTPHPLSPYGVTKLAAEHLMGLYARNFGVPTVSLRYFTVFGPRQRPDMAFTRFITRALLGRPIQLFGTGEQIRDFTFVDDVVRANMAAASAAAVSPGSVYNVSGGGSVSVNDVLGTIEQIIGKPIEVERSEKVAGDVFRTGGSFEQAKNSMKWEPSVAIAEGLERQVQWLEPLVGTYSP